MLVADRRRTRQTAAVVMGVSGEEGGGGVWWCVFGVLTVLTTTNGCHATAAPAIHAGASGDGHVDDLDGVSIRAEPDAHGLVVPPRHPRLWWTPARLAMARRWVLKKRWRPNPENPIDLALQCVVADDRRQGRKAIEWLKNVQMDVSRSVSDDARWVGEQAILIFDWCHHHLRADEERLLVQRWNHYVLELNKKLWGGPEQPGAASNYFWGYFRNSVEWAIASYHENPHAGDILTHALKTRWHDAFVPYARGPGRGGALHEGSQYGRYMLGYNVVPLTSAALHGRNLWDETDFFKQAVFFLIYALTPGPTHWPARDPAYQVFPFSDDEFFANGDSAVSEYSGAFLATATQIWSGTPVGGFAQRYLDLVKPPVPAYIQAVEVPVKALSWTVLPPDYFATGIGFFFVRNNWNPGTTAIRFQLGWAQGADHRQLDAGSFQIWRKGHWLTRESTGYGYECHVPGWSGQGVVDCRATELHNGVLLGGQGLARAYHQGLPQIIRLESRPTHAYAAVDLTPVYLSTSTYIERDVNPHAQSVVREFVYVRPLETLVVFDRLVAAGDTADQVVKTFLLHFSRPPRVDPGSRTVVGQAGDQQLRVATMVPRDVGLRVVDEKDTRGQFRLEVDARGPAQSHFLHVLQMADAGSPALKTSLSQADGHFDLSLQHPTLGSARLVLRSGPISQGGTFGFAPPGRTPVLKPLTTQVQDMLITDDGPIWK